MVLPRKEWVSNELVLLEEMSTGSDPDLRKQSGGHGNAVASRASLLTNTASEGGIRTEPDLVG